MTSMFMEEISLKYLFIGFSSDGKQEALSKKLDKPMFVNWSDLVLTNGAIVVKNIPLDKFKFVLIGTIGENGDMHSCVKAFLDKNKITYFSYGSPTYIENKLLQTTKMHLNGVSQINTVISNSKQISVTSLIKKLKLPVISKIVDGSQGKGIIKHDTKESLEKFLKKNPDTVYIFQEFIPNDGDYRAFYLGNKLIYAIKRVSKDSKEFRNNVSLGGTQEFTELESEAKKLGSDACRAMGFDVSGVDLIQDKKTKKWYIMEINAAPQFTGPEFDQVIDAFVSIIK